MYNNEYFKEVMGNQYKEDDLFENTYNKKNHDYVVITPSSLNNTNVANLKENENQIASQNESSNHNQIANHNKNLNQNQTASADTIGSNNQISSADTIENKNQNVKFANNDANNKIDESIKKAEDKIENSINTAERKIEEPMKKVETNVKDAEREIANVSSYIKKDFDKLYPEIYKIINPMIEVAINRNKDKGITNDILEKIANEIYYAIEGYEGNNIMLVSKNDGSSVLYDLIKILLLDKVANKINENSNTNNTNNNKNDSQKLANNKKIEENKSINVSNLNTINKNEVANNLNEQVDDNKTIVVSNPNVIHTEKDVSQQSNVSNIPKVSYFDIPYPEDA